MIERQRSLPFGRPGARGAPEGKPRARSRRGGRAPRRGADPAARQREALRRRQFARLMDRLRDDAETLATRFGLRYRALLIERPTARSHYGICYRDGTIKIRLNHAVYLTPLRYSSLVNTICHELAHLRHFDHGDGFKRFYGEILEWARARRIYRPSCGRHEQGVLRLQATDECEVDAREARAWLRAMRDRLRAGRGVMPGAATAAVGPAPPGGEPEPACPAGAPRSTVTQEGR